ncbi:MAG: phosphodiester glycosidase family protein [Prevotella sp.]|nr:phosphodiester glycosidase family protein [Staphylococcus sp.]MCM1350919.1 phosphodiester glycosidase family protein [Prevotella sp.]
MNRRNHLMLFVLGVLLYGVICTHIIIFDAANEKTTSDYAVYQEEERLVTSHLGYGVEHIKVNGLSSTNRCNNDTSANELSHQIINILSVPSQQNVRIINYTYPNSQGWNRQTLSKFVQRYEADHPGWVVLAGVNGDFYDWKAHDPALPYHTTGTTLSDEELLRAVESKSVGYKNDGSSTPFIIDENLKFTSYHVLTIYDEKGEVVATFPVDKVNELPVDNELAVYYTYRSNVYVPGEAFPTQYTETKVSVPADTSYIVERPIRCLPTDEPELYAKGSISKRNNEEVILSFGQFAIVTTNQNIEDKLGIGTTIRVQKQVIGKLEDCDQIIGVGSTLMENGIISENNSDGMRYDRHPRTCIGVKEDGTMMFFVIDGRQKNKGMSGMTQDEQGVLLAHYGCYEGVNIDGGGSSTFGIRNEQGEFVIMNTPSDGNERAVSNVLLVVAPELEVQLSQYRDTSVCVSSPAISKDLDIKNLEIQIGEEIKQVTFDASGFTTDFTHLNPDTTYELRYQYDIEYKGVTEHKIGRIQTFTTGKPKPVIQRATFDICNQQVYIDIDIQDIHQAIYLASYECGAIFSFLYEYENQRIVYPLDQFNQLEILLTIDYKVLSTPSDKTQIIQKCTWYPKDIQFEQYYEAEQTKIKNYIKEVNDQIDQRENFETIVEKIQYTHEQINQLSTKQMIMQYKEEKMNHLLEKDHTILGVQEIIDQVVIDLEEAFSKEAIDTIYNNALTQIEEYIFQDEITQYKTKTILDLGEWLLGKSYTKKNQKRIDEIFDQAKQSIQHAQSKTEIDTIYQETCTSFQSIRLKGCQSSGWIYFILMVNLAFIAMSMLKLKKQR